MAKPDTSIDPRILQSAKEEFLRNGYENSSLKKICADAGVTTGALYRRYKNKAALFDAVVTPTLEDFYRTVQSRRLPADPGNVTDEALLAVWEMSREVMDYWFGYLYDRYDDYRILLCGAEGTSKSDFCHDCVTLLTECSYEFLEEARRRGLTDCLISKDEMHILLTAFWVTVFEPIIHEYTWDQIGSHSDNVCRLFNWRSLLQLR